MTTTISASLGQGPLTQQGVGTTPGYDAITIRRIAETDEVGEGVTTYGSYRVSQRGAGANMSVDVNMDAYAYVRGDAVSLQSLYKIPPHNATINETVSTADATNPRVDRVILECKDTTHDASGSNLAQTRVVAGTPTGGATLDNLSGAAAVPSSALLLADVLVGAAVSSITNANIRDRRAFGVPGVVPPILTAVDMVQFQPAPGLPLVLPQSSTLALSGTAHDLHQVAAAMYLPRRIASATRIRWTYDHGGTALTGNYILGIYDSSGRKIIDTGSVAFTGASTTKQARSETITATTFEPGWYYALLGVDATNSGTVEYWGVCAGVSQNDATGSSVIAPNLLLRSATGGVTVPTTILSFTDVSTITDTVFPPMPVIALSVG